MTKRKDPAQKTGQPKPPRPARKSPSNSTSGPKQIMRLERMSQALEYRLLGYSFPRIAKEMKMPMGTVADMIYDALRQRRAVTSQKAEELLDMELERVDLLLAATMPDAADTGEPQAIQTALSVLEKRHRLLGLGTTAKVSVDQRRIGPDGVPLGNQVVIIGGLPDSDPIRDGGQAATAEPTDEPNKVDNG